MHVNFVFVKTLLADMHATCPDITRFIMSRYLMHFEIKKNKSFSICFLLICMPLAPHAKVHCDDMNLVIIPMTMTLISFEKTKQKTNLLRFVPLVTKHHIKGFLHVHCLSLTREKV